MRNALSLLRELRAEAPKPEMSIPATAGVTLDEFAGAGRALRVWSDVLGEEVVFAGDGASVAALPGLVIYRGRELRPLRGIGPDHLRMIHQAKKLFGGEVLPDDDPPGDDMPGCGGQDGPREEKGK